MFKKFLIAGLTCTAAGMVAGSAMADHIRDLGGGWQATLLDENLDLIVDFVGNDTLVIQKFAKFNETDPFTGMPESLSISFLQTGSDADTVSRIVITDMFLQNNTGIEWNGFREAVLSGGAATINQTESADFSIDPFTTRTYNDRSTTVTFAGGTIGDGEVFTPGAASGGLVIDIDLSDDNPVKFVLKETPLGVPAPGAVALLLVAGGVNRRRRRN